MVELSIVLVILGLLTGGILTGQSLIRAAELRSISTDLNRYTAAANTFRDKYFALPGDMRNAVKFWTAQTGASTDGVDATCQALDRATPATGQATCNGDGNGQIGAWTNLASSALAPEVFRAWQHLANAGLIEGSFAGVTDSTINDWTSGPVVRPAWNVPASRLNPAGYGLVYWGSHAPGTLYVTANIIFPADYGHVLIVGTALAYHAMNMNAIIKPDEAWNLDTKMDDGKPGTGKVLAPGTAVNASCHNSMVPATSEYYLSGTDANCALIFKAGF